MLFRDPKVGVLYKHDSPYNYFSSAELHLGEISLECSRAGASAVALWATQQLLPLDPGGEFSRSLDDCLAAARQFFQRVGDSPHFRALLQPELDIVVYGVAAADAAAAGARARAVFDRAAEQDLHLALISLPAGMVQNYWPELEMNRETVTCLRSCLMKPQHLASLDDIWAVLDRAVSR